jgi:hypothetical protein
MAKLRNGGDADNACLNAAVRAKNLVIRTGPKAMRDRLLIVISKFLLSFSSHEPDGGQRSDQRTAHDKDP